MSGHSKWATIKHAKGLADAKRGKIFTKFIKEISIAARMGGGDPNSNPRLRTVIIKARAANMPKDNIERAIKKGTGEDGATAYEELVYEGYAAGGVAVMVEVLTDNKNRAAADVRNIFNKNGGNLGVAGSVSRMFQRKGTIEYDAEKVSEDEVMEVALEAGADDIVNEDGIITVTTSADAFASVADALNAKGFESLSADVGMIPDMYSPVNIYDDQNKINIEGNVVFENVHFGYDPNKIIINNFSCYVKKGQQIAIVGPTGAGKTTLVKLLMRFYELNSGTIYIDDHDIKDFTRSDLRKLFGMVLQDAWLFSGTIMDNLRYGNLEASDEDVIKAAKNAHVDHFIRTLEDGYNTYINEESTNISQGQKQLLTIARAFLKDPKILILDEATSSVDTRTEIMIQKGMESLMQGRTTFVIAHRLSTIKNADMILVIKDGDIVEMGKHDELLAKNGFYAQLYNSQFENCE